MKEPEPVSLLLNTAPTTICTASMLDKFSCLEVCQRFPEIQESLQSQHGHPTTKEAYILAVDAVAPRRSCSKLECQLEKYVTKIGALHG